MPRKSKKNGTQNKTDKSYYRSSIKTEDKGHNKEVKADQQANTPVDEIKESDKLMQHIAECIQAAKIEDDKMKNDPEGEAEALQNCWGCQKQGRDLKRCVACKLAFYCDRLCQKEHWKEHKKVCSTKGTSKSNISTKPQGKKGNGGSKNVDDCSQTFTFNHQHARHIWEYVPCLYCHTPREDLLRCTQCKTAKYCNRACQRRHWSQHKEACKRFSLQPSKISDGGGWSQCEGDSKSCLHCFKTVTNGTKCTSCKVAVYCDDKCRAHHSLQHYKACNYYPRFIAMMSKVNSLLADVHCCTTTDMVFPPKPNPFVGHQAVVSGKALLLEIDGPYHHFIRHGIYVKDITGQVFHMLFYHKKEEELSLLPSTMTQLLVPGNFLRWFYPRWRFFVDGTLGFRVDSLDELEFIKKPWKLSFPSFGAV